MRSYHTSSPLEQVISSLEHDTAVLRRLADDGAGVLPEPCGAPGTVAQLKPDADPVLGGMLVRLTQIDRYGVRGYLLVPHRGGCREAWWRGAPSDIWRLGRLLAPEPSWAFRTAEREGQRQR